jgi:catechol 2,3-dioxygenase-like lactoylglutathione lyase family enzyme
MRIELHHVNLTAPDPSALASFYRDVLGLSDITDTWGREHRIEEQYAAPITFVEDDAGRQVHLSGSRPDLLFTTGREINMVGPGGHLAFRVDDLEELKRRLDAAGVPYSDYGEWAIKDWHQIFVHDPMGNVLEFHQVLEPGDPERPAG